LADPWANRAIIAFRRGDVSGAIHDLTRALALREDAAILCNRARCLRRDGNGERPPAIMRGRGRSLAPTPKRSTADATDAPKPCAGPNRAVVEVPGVTSSACFFSLAPPLRGRDEQSSLLEGRGEGHLSANSDASGQTCTPSPDASRRPLPASGAR
jgi:hypothetical protein